ncbi:MAG: hypothetical protein AAF196_16010 [Planctomycetota bacterium]
MSCYDTHPGRGQVSVGGYHDPAGSMAEAESRRVAEEARRQQEDQRRFDAEMQRQAMARTQKRSSAKPATRPAQPKKKKQGPKPKGPSRPAPKQVAQKSDDAAGFFGFIAFLFAGYHGLQLQEGAEPQWVAGAILGIVAAVIVSRIYKALLVAAIVIGIGYVVVEAKKDSDVRASSPSSLSAPFTAR